MTGRTRLVEHEPQWVPAQLPINAAGDTRPGFVCVHELENGNGPCEGNVFRLEDAIGTHSCVVIMDDIGDPPSGWCWEICPCGQACGEFADHRTPHRCWNH